MFSNLYTFIELKSILASCPIVVVVTFAPLPPLVVIMPPPLGTGH